MITFSLVAFNVLLSGALSFFVASLLTDLALRAFRPRPGKVRLLLHALPFAKLVFDVVRGIPAQSFLWLRALGVSQDIGVFQIGIGTSWFVPHVQFALGARSADHTYSQSASDLLAGLLVKRVSPWAPLIIVVALASVSTARLVRRFMAWRSASQAKQAIVGSALLVGRRHVGRQVVPIFVSPAVAGSPFLGGVAAPYVGFPAELWGTMSAAERRAALGHELAHARERHLAFVTLLGMLSDVFWFLPRVGHCQRSFREACELAADAHAVREGTSPPVLASALLRAREVSQGAQPSPVATLAATGSSLSSRIDHLLDATRAPRFGFQYPVHALVLTGWLALVVFRLVIFGNH
ncbi:MAG: M56 family metallopeptidase [Polyangiaceae bacterium]